MNEQRNRDDATSQVQTRVMSDDEKPARVCSKCGRRAVQEVVFGTAKSVHYLCVSHAMVPRT